MKKNHNTYAQTVDFQKRYLFAFAQDSDTFTKEMPILSLQPLRDNQQDSAALPLHVGREDISTYSPIIVICLGTIAAWYLVNILFVY